MVKYDVKIRVWAGVVCLLVIVFVLGGCSPRSMEIRRLDIMRDGSVVAYLTVEVAVTEPQRQQGLMFRESLDDGYGMLFVFPECDRLSFWMKNTRIPLAIAFICVDGVITEFRDLYPYDETVVISTYLARYALEVPRGWFERVGVRVGDKKQHGAEP